VFTGGDNIVPGDNNAYTDAFVRDLQTGTATLVSVTPQGTPGNLDSGGLAISPNGRYVLFSSDATNLVPGDTTATTEIFERDLVNKTTTLVSANTAGVPANDVCYSAVMTPDGRYVAFLSFAHNLVTGAPTNGVMLYLRDTVNNTTTLVSTGLPSSSYGYTTFGSEVISDNGQFVGFQAAQLYSFATRNLYVRDTVNGTTALVTPGLSGTAANGDSSNMVMTPDGHYVAFVSRASNLISNDANGAIQDVFLRDLVLNQTSIVSVTASGQSANDASAVDNSGNDENPSISNDGRYVAFSSWATNLAGITGATSHLDVYVRDMSSLSVVRAGATPSGGQSANGFSHQPLISGDGSRVAFVSYSTDLVSVPNFINNEDIFVRNLGTKTTSLVTINAAGTASSVGYGGNLVWLTTNGQFVAFNSSNGDLTQQDGDHSTDAFVRNLTTATTTMVSTRDPSLPSLTGNDISYTQVVGSHATVASADGRYVAFTSAADNLVPNDTNQNLDVFVADRVTGTVKLASVNSAGTASGNSFSQRPAISADGQVVAFDSLASNLVSLPDNNGTSDVFVHNFATNQTTLVSVNYLGTASANGGGAQPTITPDGRYVLFRSNASDLVSSGGSGYQEIYRRDLVNQTTILVSTGMTGFGATGHCQNASMTPDGRYVIFDTNASDLVSGDNNGALDVFVRDTVAEQTYLVSVNAAGTGSGDGASQNASITPDGRYVVFESTANDLVPGVTGSNSNVYVRDLVSGKTYLVSANPSGAGGNGGSQHGAISNDGRYVAFDSDASDLAPGDTNNATDVFVRDRTTGQTTLVSMNAAGTASASGNSSYPSLSADGHKVVFDTLAPDLFPNDVNGTNANIIVHDLTTGTTTVVDPQRSRYGTVLTQTNAITPDGHHVVFVGSGDDLTPGDFNSYEDVIEWSDASPVANPGSGYTVPEGASVTLDGSASTDADSTLTTYEWDFNYNGTFVTDATGVTTSFSAAGLDGPGTRTVALRVTDQAGAQSIATATVSITNVAPTVTPPSDQSATAGLSASFALGSFSDPGPDANWSVDVDWGDASTHTTFLVTAGNQPSGAALNLSLGNASHTYAAIGTDTVTVKVTDKDGASQSATFHVTVSQSTDHFSVSAASVQLAGAPFSVTVTARDTSGNVRTGYTGTVHFTSSDTQAGLPADYTFTTADAGSHVFSVTLKTAGSQSITVADTTSSTIAGSQSGITVNPAAASTFRVAGFPSSTTAGVSQSVIVTATDLYGNTATGYTGTVHFTSSDTKAVLPSNYTFTTTDAGVHTFAVTLKTAGTQSITATDSVTASINGSQTGISVGAAAANSLSVTGFPTSTVAGLPHNFTVTAKDTYGNAAASYVGTVHFTTTDWEGVLPANYTFTPADSGIHTFTATLKAAYYQTITATDTAHSTVTGQQSGILVSPAAFAKVVITSFPASVIAGAVQSFNVAARDAYSNTIPNYAGTVHFSGTDAQAALPTDYTYVAADHGIHTFSAALKTAGTQRLTVGDTSLPSSNFNQSVVVTPTAAAVLVVAGYPSPTTAGTTHSFAITVTDAYGNVVTGYTHAVHFTSSDPQAALPADYTFTATDAGKHTFSAALQKAGSQSITATDTTTSAVAGTQSGLIVNPAAASTLTLSGFPAAVVAGSSQNLTVSMKDAYGNIATSYAGTIHFTTSDAQGVLPVDYSFIAADAGVHTFSATLATAGSQSITATDIASSGITGNQSGITVTAAAASVLSVAGFPSTTTAGTPQNFTVTAKDPFGNIATSYTGAVHFTSSDSQASLPADYSFVTGDAGVHTFSATLMTAGSQSITATDKTTSTITGTESGITVVSSGPAQASSFVVSGYPATTAGASQTFTVTVKDSHGNTVTGYTGTIHFTSSDPKAVLPADYTFTAPDSGVHTFSATLKTAGTQSITATDTTTSSVTGSQTSITVSAAAASTLSLGGFPTSTTAGVAHTVTVTLKDAFGNIAAGYTGTVHFTTTDWEGVLPANYAFTAGDAGTHVFTATLKAAGTQTITATDTTQSSLTSKETGIQVSAAAFAKVVILSYPSTTVAGVSHTFTVAAQDAYSNTISNYTGTVAFSSSDAKASLPATYTFVAADQGKHTFNATLKTAGSQRLSVVDTSLASSNFNQGVTVTPAVAATLSITGYPSPTAVGASHTFVLTMLDAYGNVASGYLGTIHFTSSDTLAILPTDYTFTTADAGKHTFSATFKTSGTQSLTATDTITLTITGSQAGIVVQ
jgi:hypothetical protein